MKIKISFLFVTVSQAIRKILLAFFLLLFGELALKQQVGVPGDFFLLWSMLKLAFGNQLINFRIFLRRAGQPDHMKYGNAGRKAVAGTGVWSAIMQ